MKQKFLTFASAFFLFFILFFPVKIGSSDYQRRITEFLFQDLTNWIGSLFFNKKFLIDFSSDSFSMLILMLILAISALIISLFLKKNQQFINFSQKITVYYLAVVLLKYGADKLFKGQFYKPEPNILFTKFGNLDQDILFWSLMGTSRSYSAILGSIEIGVALLLLFKKTRFLGLILAFLTFVNILIINFSFDISVKMFSITLFLMTIFALKDYWTPLYLILIQKTFASTQISELKIPEKIKVFVLPLKVLTIGFVFLQIFLPYFTSNIYNDDNSKRPILHGAYEVLNQNSHAKNNLKYVFFHRDQYLIFMNDKDETVDFKYEIDATNKKIKYRDFEGKFVVLNYYINEKSSTLLLKNEKNSLQLIILDWKKMPALKSQFHWFVEQL